MDWGLLQFKSKNWLLRDKLLIPYRSVYFGAMVLNVLLRFAWLQTVLNFQVSFPHTQTLSAIVASLADYGTFSGWRMNIYTMLSSISHSSLYLYLSTTMLAKTNMSSILHQKKINRQEVSYPRTNSKERKHYRDVLRSTISEELDCFLTHFLFIYCI